jgi:hypothetical protein
MLSAKHVKYACNDTKVFIGFKEVSLKATQSTLYRTQLHGIKSLAKGATNGIGHALMMGSPIKN